MAEEKITNETVNANETVENAPQKQEDNSPTIEELMAQVAKQSAEIARLNNKANDAAAEAAKFKKALREKQTAQEREDDEKRKAEEEHQAYVADLEKFKKQAEAEKRYTLMGMSEEFASRAAEAEISGDYESLTKTFSEYNTASMKAKEAEWLKNRPSANAGHGESMTDEELLAKQVESAMGL